MKTILPESQNPYLLRSGNHFHTENIRTVYYGKETISFIGPKTWAMVPNEIKQSNSLNEFKRKVTKGMHVQAM